MGRLSLNKKGQLGLETVKSVIVMVLVLAVVTIALFVGVTTLSDESVIPRELVAGNSFTNVSIVVNNTNFGADTPSAVTAFLERKNVIYTNVVALNSTGALDDVIGVGNFTFGSLGEIGTAINGLFNYSGDFRALNSTINKSSSKLKALSTTTPSLLITRLFPSNTKSSLPPI